MTDNDSRLTELYEKLAQKTKEIYAESSEKTAEALESALEKAKDSLEKAGELSRQEGDKLKLYLRRDIEQASRRIVDAKSQAKDYFEPLARSAETGFLNLTYHLATNASAMLGRLAEWADSASAYHTGQVTSPGTLQCRACGKTMTFKKTGNIPPCPSCHKTDFRKID